MCVQCFLLHPYDNGFVKSKAANIDEQPSATTQSDVEINVGLQQESALRAKSTRAFVVVPCNKMFLVLSNAAWPRRQGRKKRGEIHWTQTNLWNHPLRLRLFWGLRFSALTFTFCFTAR